MKNDDSLHLPENEDGQDRQRLIKGGDCVRLALALHMMPCFVGLKVIARIHNGEVKGIHKYHHGDKKDKDQGKGGRELQCV